jgi:integrase
VLVTTRNGRAYGEHHFHREFREALNACGLKHLSFHGLRHAAGVALAEGGATEKEIMAWLGHSTPAMAAHYCRAADQKRLARSAAIKLIRTRTEQESGKSDG